MQEKETKQEIPKEISDWIEKTQQNSWMYHGAVSMYHHLSPLLEEKERKIKELEDENERIREKIGKSVSEDDYSYILNLESENEKLEQRVKELEGLLRFDACPEILIENPTLLNNNPDKKALDWGINMFNKLTKQPSDIKTVEDKDLREKIAEILRDDITFSPQINTYLIHGAIEKIIELFKPASQFRAVPDEAVEKALAFMEYAKDSDLFYDWDIVRTHRDGKE